MGRAASAAWVGVCLSLVLGAPAFAAGPTPDPPPIKHAPPPPPAPEPPAAPQPPPPPEPAAPPPTAIVIAPPARSVTHPTAAERRAKAANARAKAANARAKAVALRAKAAKRAARQKAARAKHLQTTEQIRAQPPPLAAGASGTGSSSVALPILLLAFISAVVMLGLAMTPTRAVPWSRASHALEDHRDELGVIGFFALVATMVFFVLVQVTK